MSTAVTQMRESKGYIEVIVNLRTICKHIRVQIRLVESQNPILRYKRHIKGESSDLCSRKHLDICHFAEYLAVQNNTLRPTENMSLLIGPSILNFAYFLFVFQV
jgi:hypothetical protein